MFQQKLEEIISKPSLAELENKNYFSFPSLSRQQEFPKVSDGVLAEIKSRILPAKHGLRVKTNLRVWLYDPLLRPLKNWGGGVLVDPVSHTKALLRILRSLSHSP